MVNYCRVIGCHNRQDREKHLEFYRLPKVIINQDETTLKLSEERRRLWLSRLHQNFEGKNLDNIRICSAHFVSGKKSELYQKHDPDWAPSLHMSPVHNSSQKDSRSSLDRLHRRKSRSEKISFNASSKEISEHFELTATPNEHEVLDAGIVVQTELTVSNIDAMESELQILRTENITLKEQLKKKTMAFDFQWFETMDDKVLFFTGLQSWHILLTLYTYLQSYIPVKKSISSFQMLILTMMRLRLNVSNSFLGFLFGISPSTVTRVIHDFIDIMYIRMRPFILWPSREALQKTMPMQFRQHFGKKCVVIIDCFEIFIDRPSHLKARAETWSSYKHHNTIKFLIGITPQGTISYISNSWGGRASDKFITEHCGFLDKIVPGDLVLADRGFDIKDTLGCMMAQVKIPAFTKGKSQLGPVDIEDTRHIASVRIHVERVIGCVRQKYSILSSQIPIDFLIRRENDTLPLIDKMVHVCCACVNLCESVVDFE